MANLWVLLQLSQKSYSPQRQQPTVMSAALNLMLWTYFYVYFYLQILFPFLDMK